MKLSEAQLKALQLAAGDYFQNRKIKFRTGESLRKLGLLNRYTETISRGVYITADSETVQRWGEHERHEWYITRAGREALNKGGFDA